MPELPEVETTSKMLDALVAGKKITGVWSDYNSEYYKGKKNIKDPKYFSYFKKQVVGHTILKVWRRAKNVLIDISGDKTILIHMKMTGHLLFGQYIFLKTKSRDKKSQSFRWKPADKDSPLADPFNRFIHLVFTLSDGHHIAFSDMRKFATVKLIADKVALGKEFSLLGPEPLDKNFSIKHFVKALQKRPSAKIKTALMDSNVIAGIGNIYSDEILWHIGVHPEREVRTLSKAEIEKMFRATKEILKKGINFGGDSMSDYRNPLGKKGAFQNKHRAYRLSGKPCSKKGCAGKITRKIVGGRSAHFCSIHQIY